MVTVEAPVPPAADVKAPVVTSLPKPDSLRTEPPPDPEIAKQSVDLAWNETINLILAKYDTKEETVTQQLAKQLGKEPDAQAVAIEVKKRQEALAAKPELKSALEQIIKADAAKKAADQALIANDQKEPDEKVQPEAIVAQYYNATDGVYYEIGPDGKPTQNAIRLEHAVKPIIDEMLEIAKEKTQTDPAKPAESSAEAKRMQSFAQILLPRLVETPGGGYKFDKTPNLSIVKRIVEEQRAKESREREENQVELVCRVIKETVGIDVAKAIKDASKGLDGDIAQDLLKKIDPSKPLGSLALRLSAYLSLPPDFPAEERSILSSLIFEELKSFQQDLELKGNQPELLKLIRDFHEQNRSYFEGHFNTFKKLVLLSAGYGEEKHIAELIPKLHSSRLADGVVLAYTCQTEVEEKKGEEPQLKEAAYNALQAFLKENRFNELEATIFNSLAVNKSAGALLKRIGLDPEELKKPAAVETATQKVVDEMNKRRKSGEPPMSPKESANYRTVLKYHAEGSLNKINSKHPLASWLKAIGMLALILGPSFQQLLETEGSSERGQQEGR